MSQPDLFDPPAQRHSATSRAAGEAIKPKASSLRELVFTCVASRGELGATDEEIIEQLGLSPSTARPRRVELWQAGRLLDSERTRKTRSGREATVWVAKR